MSTANEKLLKLAHDTKKAKNKNMMRIGQQASHSVDPSPVVDIEPEGANADARPGKRHHGENTASLSKENHERGFVLPPCVSESSYFGWFPLSVSPADTQAI